MLKTYHEHNPTTISDKEGDYSNDDSGSVLESLCVSIKSILGGLVSLFLNCIHEVTTLIVTA